MIFLHRLWCILNRKVSWELEELKKFLLHLMMGEASPLMLGRIKDPPTPALKRFFFLPSTCGEASPFTKISTWGCVKGSPSQIVGD